MRLGALEAGGTKMICAVGAGVYIEGKLLHPDAVPGTDYSGRRGHASGAIISNYQRLCKGNFGRLYPHKGDEPSGNLYRPAKP